MDHPIPTSQRSSSESVRPWIKRVSRINCATYEHWYRPVSKYHNDPMTMQRRRVKDNEERRPMTIIIMTVDHRPKI